VAGSFGYSTEPLCSIKGGEFRDLNGSGNVIGVIKSNRVRWAENVAHMEEMKNAYKF
jgi:hypothetical protein